MGFNTSIEWTDNSHNFWLGCRKISPGCKFCYMFRDMKRYGRNPDEIVRAKGFDKPLSWKEPARVFVNSWSDFFIEQADAWRADAWDIIRQTPHLTYQILTKRPENIADRLPADWGNGWPNVWLGVSVENADYYGRLHLLQAIPAHIRFISYEPALGPVVLRPWLETVYFHWVISGGESGYNPRPARLDWFRNVRDQCQRYDVAYFHKQHGGKRKINGTWGGRELDGQTWSQFPQ